MSLDEDEHFADETDTCCVNAISVGPHGVRGIRKCYQNKNRLTFLPFAMNAIYLFDEMRCAEKRFFFEYCISIARLHCWIRWIRWIIDAIMKMQLIWTRNWCTPIPMQMKLSNSTSRRMPTKCRWYAHTIIMAMTKHELSRLLENVCLCLCNATAQLTAKPAKNIKIANFPLNREKLIMNRH